MKHRIWHAIAVSILCVPVVALAQAYPNRPIKLVVTFAAGGSADIVARAIVPQLSEALGQPVVIDNRAGAGGTIGANAVAQAAPDGYTLLFAATGPNAVAPGINKSLPYDPIRSFAPISRVSMQPAIIAANPELRVTSVAQLIALARSSPGKLNFASPGIGTTSHLGGELFKMLANVDLVHVPYKDGRLAVTDVIEGRINVMFDNLGTFLPHVRAGKLRALALASDRRTSTLPDLPTAKEAGLAGFEYSIWFGVSAPAQTPEPIISLLHGKISEVLKSPRVAESFASLNAEVSGTTPREFQDFIAADIEKWARVIKSAGISPK